MHREERENFFLESGGMSGAAAIRSEQWRDKRLRDEKKKELCVVKAIINFISKTDAGGDRR